MPAATLPPNLSSYLLKHAAQVPAVKLDEVHFKLVDAMERHISPGDEPSLIDARSLVVKGPVKFQKGKWASGGAWGCASAAHNPAMRSVQERLVGHMGGGACAGGRCACVPVPVGRLWGVLLACIACARCSTALLYACVPLCKPPHMPRDAPCSGSWWVDGN